MARPNGPRSIEGESNLARRIQMEREARGWSYETLARHMTEAGCSIAAASIFKVEKGTPPRRITVDELLALSRVFEVSVDNLLTPIETLRSERGRELAGELERAADGLHRTVEALVNGYAELLEMGTYDQDFSEFVQRHLESFVGSGAEEAPLLGLVVNVDGEERTAQLDDGPVRAGLQALMVGVVEVAGQAAEVAVQANTGAARAARPAKKAR